MHPVAKATSPVVHDIGGNRVKTTRMLTKPR